MPVTLDQKIAATQLKLARLKERSRADNTRQKIVTGGAVISLAIDDPEAARVVLAAFNATPPRDHDQKVVAGLITKLKSVAAKDDRDAA